MLRNNCSLARVHVVIEQLEVSIYIVTRSDRPQHIHSDVNVQCYLKNVSITDFCDYYCAFGRHRFL